MQNQETNNNEVIIGSHVKMCAPDYFLGSVNEAASYGANALMLYTGAPQNFNRVELSKCKIDEALIALKQNNIDINNVICHAPYLINLANTTKEGVFETSLQLLISEIERTNAFGIKYIVLHPGASVGGDEEMSINQIAKGLNLAIKKTKNVIIAIETMAGKGSEIGYNLCQIDEIISKVEDKSRIGVCLDTCHLNDSGYDLNDIDSLINDIKSSFGIERVVAIHLNDSKNQKGSHKDRHDNIGNGFIGFDILNKIAHLEIFKDVPKILETPYVNEKAPYKNEIEMIRKGIFDKDAINNL